MNRRPVASSRLHAVGYDAKTGNLEVEFPDGTVWVYHGVPREVYVSLLTAPSIGRYFNRYVVGAYDYERL